MDAGRVTSDETGPSGRSERALVVALSLLVALTRWPAVSLTLWDWDEALFSLALRDYDVVAHHPHPPGFPLFIAAARLFPLEPFRAVQWVTLLSSLFVFPAMYLLARELKLTPFRATAAALLLSFFPNVWFFGGTAFSDVPSMVLVVTACALLLRGRRSGRSMLAGALLLGIAAGFRPQNLMIGLVPFALACLSRKRLAVTACAVVGAIVAASYSAAAMLSGGWQPYRDALTRHEQFIRQTDSFLAPLRPWLPQVADDFFVRPFRAPLLNIAITVLALLGLRRRNWIALATFGPFVLFAWLFLDFHSASRFSIAYMPLVALLVAEGIPGRGRKVTLAILVAAMAGWTWPALRLVHTTASPPVAAAEWIRAHDPRMTLLHVDSRLAAHAELLLPEYERVIGTNAPPRVEAGERRTVLLLREGASSAAGAENFTRERGRLAGIARPRYFEVSVVRVKMSSAR